MEHFSLTQHNKPLRPHTSPATPSHPHKVRSLSQISFLLISHSNKHHFTPELSPVPLIPIMVEDTSQATLDRDMRLSLSLALILNLPDLLAPTLLHTLPTIRAADPANTELLRRTRKPKRLPQDFKN